MTEAPHSLDRGARVSTRALRADSGQGLVEYALIIAIVSLGAVIALGFLSGKINGLFSKAGSSLNTITIAAGSGGGTTQPPPSPPADGTDVIVGSGPLNDYFYYGPGAASGNGGLGGLPSGLEGFYTLFALPPTPPTHFTLPNGWSFDCSWHNAPLLSWWTGSPPPQGNPNLFISACYNAGPPPPDGTSISLGILGSATWFNAGTVDAHGSTSPDGAAGLYTNNDLLQLASCNFTYSNGYQGPGGSWHNAGTNNSNGYWVGSTRYRYGCF
jgi:pilus assembly protein Flp/PilA